LVRKSSCPGAIAEVSRITAPDPKTITVFVDSEKGSRLSLPSAVRAPLTVMGISSATGCALIVDSMDADPERAGLSGAVSVSEPLVMGAI
jgi:hypothetical protein